MEPERQLRALLDLVESLGILLRRMPAGEGGSPGALVRLRDREMLFLDPAAPVADQVAVVADALRGRPGLEELYLPPELRELIEGGGG